MIQCIDTMITAALQAFLDLLLCADEPGFHWGPPELRAAFQWADTLQQLVDDAGAVAAVQAQLQVRWLVPPAMAGGQPPPPEACCSLLVNCSTVSVGTPLTAFLQELGPQLPAGLTLALPALRQHPLQLLLEALLRRCPPPAGTGGTATPSGEWMEAVLAAYMAAVVLPSPDERRAAAERRLLAALAGLQQAAAVQSLMAGAAMQAAAARAAQLRHHSSGNGGSERDRLRLMVEALQHLTSQACVEAAAAAQLAADRVHHYGVPLDSLLLLQQPQSSLAAAEEVTAAAATAIELEVEVLCFVALLPSWEAMLRRLARPDDAGPCRGPPAASDVAARQALQLLCAACGSEPTAVLAQHPALLAEACRPSFPLT